MKPYSLTHITSLALLLSGTLACNIAKEDQRSASKEKNAELSFTNAADGGRHVAFVDIQEPVVDFTKVHPATAEFHELNSESSINVLHNESTAKILFKFTNNQEAIHDHDAEELFKLGCEERDFGNNYQECVYQAIAKSGAIVFGLSNPTANPNDPTDIGHFWDAVKGTVGLTRVKADYGTEPVDATMGSCILCHNSAQVINGTMNFDMRGVASHADPLAGGTASFVEYFTRSKEALANPSQHQNVLNISDRVVAAGMVIDQYNRLREQNQNWFMSDDNIENYWENANIRDAINSGFYLASLTGAFSATTECDNQMLINGDFDRVCEGGIDNDNLVASSTSQVPINEFIDGSRQNIRQTLYNEVELAGGPLKMALRPMRSNVQTSDFEKTVFALPYLKFDDTESTDSIDAARRYLLGATAAYIPAVSAIDGDIAMKWTGMGPDLALQFAKEQLTRYVPRGYAQMSIDYHTARQSDPLSVEPQDRPSITKSELTQSKEYIDTCFACHTGGKAILDPSHPYYLSYDWGDRGWAGMETGVDPNYSAAFETPSSKVMKSLWNSIETPPAEVNGLFGVHVNTDIRSEPHRISFLRKQGGFWNFLSIEDALSTNPPPPSYAVLSSGVDQQSGRLKVRTMYSGLDLNEDGVVSSAEPLQCREGSSFTIGTETMSCKAVLKLLSDAMPRLINTSDAFKFHRETVGIQLPSQDPAAMAALAATWQSMVAGGMTLTSDNKNCSKIMDFYATSENSGYYVAETSCPDSGGTTYDGGGTTNDGGATTDGSATTDDGSATTDDGSATTDDGSATTDDGSAEATYDGMY